MPTVSFGMDKPSIKICADSNKKASTFGFYYFQEEGILSSSFFDLRYRPPPTCGKLLFSNDEEKRTDFVEYARKIYIDCLPIYCEYHKELLKRTRKVEKHSIKSYMNNKRILHYI
jgi:hypothetical protein